MEESQVGYPTAVRQVARAALILAVLGALAALAWPGRAIDRPAGGPPPQFADRLDPNLAAWWQLERLPGVGESLAKAIVSERERRSALRPGEPAFVRPESLLHVRGLGEKKLAPILPYLRFPTSSAPAAVGGSSVDTTPLPQ